MVISLPELNFLMLKVDFNSMNYVMSKRRAKFPHRLTWEWSKNRYHYCLPLMLKNETNFNSFPLKKHAFSS